VDSEIYPLLTELLRILGRPLLGTFTKPDAAAIFGVHIRTIQKHVKDCTLPSHPKLMGKACFLPSDFERYLQQSRRPPPE
jgi:hypothetical protein